MGLHAIDRNSRDVTHNPDIPMSGNVVALGGDFGQTLPVVHRAHQSVIIENYFETQSVMAAFQSISINGVYARNRLLALVQNRLEQRRTRITGP